MADLPGDPAQPRPAAVGPEDPRAGGRRAAGAVGGARRRLLRPRSSASPSSAGRARPPAADGARGRPLLARRDVRRSPPSASLAGILPGFVIDALSPVADGARRRTACRRRRRSRGCRSCRSRESRSSYNGLLVFVFIAASAALAASPSTASPRTRVRRAPAWDCGFPDPSPATQYTAGQLRPADPPRLRRSSSGARETVDMPPPGDMRPARLRRRPPRSRLGRALPAGRGGRRLPPTGSTASSS